MDNHCTEWYNFSHKRIYKTRSFARWARKVGVSNDALCKAVSEMSQGLIDADLGGYVVKKRVTLPGQGKRGGGANHRRYKIVRPLVFSIRIQQE